MTTDITFTSGVVDLKGNDPSGSYDTAITFTTTSVVSGSTYYFRVRAHNAHGWGPYSNLMTASQGIKAATNPG
jgi:hypothetical protein